MTHRTPEKKASHEAPETDKKGLSKADWFRICRIFRPLLTEQERIELWDRHQAKLARQGA